MGWILVVEDNKSISDYLSVLLEDKNFKVVPCRSYKEAIKVIDEMLALKKNDEAANNIDILVCDLNILPRQDKATDSVGFQVLEYIKRNSPDTYSIIYTGSDVSVAKKCVGLGNVYFQKTSRSGFMSENMATVEELADHIVKHINLEASDKTIKRGGVEYNYTKRTASLYGKPLYLEMHELDVLEALIGKPDVFFTEDELLELITATKPLPLLCSPALHVRNCMMRLNGKLDAGYIVCRRNLGYAFSVPRT